MGERVGAGVGDAVGVAVSVGGWEVGEGSTGSMGSIAIDIEVGDDWSASQRAWASWYAQKKLMISSTMAVQTRLVAKTAICSSQASWRVGPAFVCRICKVNLPVDMSNKNATSL
ncbi:MAG: hypothetical protein Kow0063_39800 [Anaerolineae bacterium]